MDRQIVWKKYFLPIAIAIVIAISWVGVLDEYSDDYTTKSITEAAASYAIARGINAAVSVLQTTTFEGGVGVDVSITLGEILDPINDLIERFSHVMTFALGSLVLQKTLLAISAHEVFKILITASGLMLVAALLIKNIAILSWVTRIFALLIFVRFSLVIVVLLNGVVDSAFISRQIQSGSDELKEFRDDMVQLDNNKIDIAGYKESIRDDLLMIDDINTTKLPGVKLKLAAENNYLMEATSDLEEIQKKMDWEDRWNPFDNNKKVIEAEHRIDLHEQQIEKLQSDLEEQEDNVEQLREKIDVSEKRLAGEPVGIWEIIKNGLGVDYVSGLNESLSIEVIEENITDTVSNIILLSVLFILKTILIPLVFFFVFIMGLKEIWKAEFTSIISNEEKLATKH